MKKQYLLGIDVGTTNVKAVIIDDNATTVATAVKEYETHFPHVAWAVQDPQDWWDCFCSVLPEACAKAGIQPGDICGIGASCQSPTLVPMSREGQVLYPAMIWMDRRSDAQCRRLEESIGENRLFEITGDLADPYYLLSETMWLKENEPGIYDATYMFLQANSYINYCLTGEFSADDVNSSLSGLFDYRTGAWSSEIFNHPAVGLDMAKFPTPVPAEQIIGRVHAAAAAQTGLRIGTPVVAGTVDSAGAAVECGSIHAGDACEMTGTSSVLVTVSDEPHVARGLTYMRHQVPGKHILLGAISTTGGAYKWCRDLFGNGYEEMNRRILADSPDPSGLLFLPYLTGERAPIWSTEAKGAWIGMSMSTNRGQMLRAVLEGTAFALRHNMDAIRDSGCEVKTLGCSGGHTNSEIWLKIKAAVTGLPIMVPEANSGAPWGAACLAGSAVGMFGTTEELLKRVLKVRSYIEPDPEWQKIYDEQYALYKQGFPSLKSIYVGLHEMNNR